MMRQSFTFCVPCLFGLEGLAADELRRLDLAEVRAEDGRVFFTGPYRHFQKPVVEAS